MMMDLGVVPVVAQPGIKWERGGGWFRIFYGMKSESVIV
jgi:hypothetical protein